MSSRPVARPSSPEPSSPAPAPTRRVVEAPRVRRLGTLPHVTTAFGGSFTP